MGPVWRGENTAHGRYREFWQCDFDTIGTDSNAADIETALVVHDLLDNLDREFGFGGFEIRINNRLVLNGFLEANGLADKSVAVLRALDKLLKMGREKVIHEMVENGVPHDKADTIVWFAEMPEAVGPDANEKALARVGEFFGKAPNEKAAEGTRRLWELLEVAKKSGIPKDRIKIDLSIARGLDYYTGTIYETFLQAMPGIGSICSGGRYDNLASLYTKQVLPGVGASLGLDRFLAALEELGKLDKTATPAPVIIFCQALECLGDYQRIARTLRGAGIGVEVYPDQKKLGQQFQYAERRGHKVALIARPEEIAKQVWNVKDLAAEKQQNEVPETELVQTVKQLLSAV
jgi:histidyl-tRNA synthetase